MSKSTEELDFVSYAEALGYRNPMYLPQNIKDCLSKALRFHKSECAKRVEETTIEELASRFIDDIAVLRPYTRVKKEAKRKLTLLLDHPCPYYNDECPKCVPLDNQTNKGEE